MNENITDNELFDGQESYDLPAPKEVVVDKTTGKILENFKPIHVILASAQENKIRIKVPAFNDDGSYDTGCRRKNCMGRGYIGTKDGMPIVCSCMFYHEDLMNPDRNKIKLNRKNARKYVSMQTTYKDDKRKHASSLGLKQVDSDTWVNSNKIQFSSRWNESKKKWIFEKKN